jgi:hypothetical protein
MLCGILVVCCVMTAQRDWTVAKSSIVALDILQLCDFVDADYGIDVFPIWLTSSNSDAQLSRFAASTCRSAAETEVPASAFQSANEILNALLSVEP